ncbi:MAG: ectoine synthase [Rhodospirillales bacterium]|jgi:hypothetical protein
MIVKSKDDVIGTKGDASGNKWHSLRLLHAEDGVGVIWHYPGQENLCAERTAADTAGLNERPGTLTNEIVRLTEGSTRGLWINSGIVTEYSGMNANPIRARTIAGTPSNQQAFNKEFPIHFPLLTYNQSYLE